jgi:opacity protein-like surface antigen
MDGMPTDKKAGQGGSYLHVSSAMLYTAFQTVMIHDNNNRIRTYDGGLPITKMTRFKAFFVFMIVVIVFPFNLALAGQGAYVSLFGGYTFSPDASWSNDDSVYDYDLDVRQSGVFGFKIGATAPFPENYVSAEFEYNYLNPDADRTVLTTAGDDYSAVEGDVKIHNFMFNILVHYPEGKIHPYIGLGAGVSSFDLSLKSTSRVNGVLYSERRSSGDTVFAWQAMAGVDIDLANNFSLDIGCRYFDAEYLDAEYDVYYSNDNSQAEYHHEEGCCYEGPAFDFKTFMVTLGLKLRF